MAALTKDRNTKNRANGLHADPAAAGAQVFSGALVVLNATNYAEPATAASGLRVRGVAVRACNNSSGGDGDGTVHTRAGTHFFHNAGDIDRSHIGTTAYIVDDHTVTANSAGSSEVGRIDDVETNGVWVFID